MHRLVRSTLIALLAGLLLVIIWSLDKGLDITDESMSLLLYLRPDAYDSSLSTQYFLIVDRVTGWAHPTVVGYRWLTLGLTLVKTLALTAGFCLWLGRVLHSDSGRSLDIMLALPFLLIGGLFPHGIGLRTLGYNTLNSVLLFSVCGLLLYVVAPARTHSAQPVRGLAALFLVGVLSALDLFVKFPTAFAMFGATVLLIVFQTRPLAARPLARAVGSLIAGALAGLLLYAACVNPVTEWLSWVRGGPALRATTTYSPAVLLLGNLQQTASLVTEMARHFAPVVVAGLVVAGGYVRGWHRESWSRRAVVIAAALLMAGYGGYKAYALNLLDLPYFNGWTTIYPYVLIVCFQIMVLAASSRPWSRSLRSLRPHPAESRLREALPGLLLLAALPLIGAVGTRNVIFLNVLLDLAGWFALLLVLGLLIEERTGSRLILSLSVLLSASAAAATIAYGSVWQPYMLAAPIPDQNVALEEPSGVRGLKVDPATAAFITDLRSTLLRGSFREQDYILGFYNVPGLVYLMNGISPGTPTYFANEDARNCLALESSDFHERNVFVLTTRDVEPEIVACLDNAGVSFPGDFVELARIYNPYNASSYGWRPGPWVTVFRRNRPL